MGFEQVFIYSDNSGIEVVDVLTGTTLTSFKTSNPIGSNCLSLLASDYLVYAESDSAIVHFKPINSSPTDRPVKVICPGKVSALATTSNGSFCIVGIGEKCYIWHIQTGDAVAILNKHCRHISVIRTSSDGSTFVTGGADGFVFFWDMSSIIGNLHTCNAPDVTPKHSWSSHQDKVTGVTYGSFDSKVASCSKDKSCRIYDVLTGDQLAVIYLPVAIESISMDPMGYFLFPGGSNGIIYETKLYEESGSDIFSRKSKDGNPTFVGHKDEVTCVTTSLDGQALISSSSDSKVKLWSILAKHCVRTIQSKGIVGNLFCVTTCHGFLPSSSNSSCSSFLPSGKGRKKITISSTFKRNTPVEYKNLSAAELVDSLEGEEDTLQGSHFPFQSLSSPSLPSQEKGKKQGSGEEIGKEGFNDRMMKRRGSYGNDFQTGEQVGRDLVQEVQKLKQINEGLFRYSVDEIFKNIVQ